MFKKIILVLLVVLVLIFGLFFYIRFFKRNPEFSVTFFNVGQGDAALITFVNGEKMLVDCGPDRRILSKLGGSLPFYDREIDFLLITHPDNDHYGGCVDVLKRYKVKTIIANNYTKDSDPYWQIWNRSVQEEGAVRKIINGPEEMTLAGATLDFVSPDPFLNIEAKASDSNNRSIVFRLRHNNRFFLFTGDMEEPLEQALISKYCFATSTTCPALKSNVLKIGHHGSDSSTSAALLAAVNPEEAVFSVGKNTFGHPSLRVLKKLERGRIKILRTDENGDILER